MANTYEEFQALAQQYAYFGPMAVVLAFVFALAVVFAFVNVGPTPVTCVSGNTCLPSIEQMLPPQGSDLQSSCTNESSRTIWVSVKGHTGFKRLALHPGQASLDLGVKRVDAVLIGGRGNALTAVRLPSGEIQTSGCYVIAADADAPAMVTVMNTDGEAAAISTNDAQASAERLGRAGYSSLNRAEIAPFADRRFAMDSSAALLPPTANPRRLFATLAANEKHARALHRANWLNALRPAVSRLA